MNLFKLNNDQMLRILTKQDYDPNLELIGKLILAFVIFFAILIVIWFQIEHDHRTEEQKRKKNKLRIAEIIVALIEVSLIISLIALTINTIIFNTQVVNKYEKETRTWMTKEITATAEKNPLIFTNLAIAKEPFDFDTFTYDDNNLTTTIDLMVGSIDIKANIDTHDVTIEPNNIEAAIIVKIQAALNNNDIKLNPKSIELDKTNNQIKALISDSNEIVTINYSNDINDTIINIESTGSKPITITLD